MELFIVTGLYWFKETKGTRS